MESHVHCAGLSLETEWRLAGLGFQPDFFISCVPDTYSSCWTLRLHACNEPYRPNRISELFKFVRRQLNQVHYLLCDEEGPAYSEVEVYTRNRRRRWRGSATFSHLSSALAVFPFRSRQFEPDHSVTWTPSHFGCGYDVAHKQWDLHIKVASIAEGNVSWQRDSVLRHTVYRFQCAGFYKAVSDSGGLFVTAQLKDRNEAISAFRDVVRWADKFPGILESAKIERCPSVWAKAMGGAAASFTLSPLPPLMKRAPNDSDSSV
jgi:hypothetical protein